MLQFDIKDEILKFRDNDITEEKQLRCKCKPNTCQYNPIYDRFQCYKCGGFVDEI